MDYSLFLQLATSLGLGLLVGLQREHAQSALAGIRTFPLITLTGTLCGFLSQLLGTPWIVAAGLLSVSLLIMAANFVRGESLAGRRRWSRTNDRDRHPAYVPRRRLPAHRPHPDSRGHRGGRGDSALPEADPPPRKREHDPGRHPRHHAICGHRISSYFPCCRTRTTAPTAC